MFALFASSKTHAESFVVFLVDFVGKALLWNVCRISCFDVGIDHYLQLYQCFV